MDDVTRLPEEAPSGTEVGAASVASERFEPGTIFAGRFRIIAPLGSMSRPYTGAAMIVILSIAAVAAYGFYASRGYEPLFGQALLD